MIVLLFITFSIINPYIFAFLYIVGWITDALDGKVARYLGITGKLAEWDFIFDTFFQWTIIAYGAYIGSLPLLFFWIWSLLWLALGAIIRNKAVIALMGTLGVIIHLVLLYWYNSFVFGILITFWLIHFEINIHRFVGRLTEFQEDASKLKKSH